MARVPQSTTKGGPKLALLQLDTVYSGYGAIEALQGISLTVGQGEIVTLIGSNGAGKSTTLKTISGIVQASKGSILFAGESVGKLPPHVIVQKGIGHVPEGRRIFPRMTVLENLEMGAYVSKNRQQFKESLERVMVLFPRIKERLSQKGGTLSGGEQQMLAIGRALMMQPKILLLDEPSMGLAPLLVEQIFEIIKELNHQGTTILLVEQNANQALHVANRGYVIVSGQIVLHDTAENLRNNEMVREAYLGTA